MADKIIAAQLQVNTGSSGEDVGKINKELANTGKTLGDTNQKAAQGAGTFDTLKDAIGKVPGPLKGVTEGVGTVNTSLKALAANPIVLVITALVAALVALYKAFASTEEGAEKIEQIMDGIGAVITTIRDRILKLAGAVISFFKGDFKEAAAQAKEAVTGVGDAIVKAYTAAADATRRLQEAEDDLNRVLNVSRAKLERDLAKTKELITDETASYRDRRKAIDEVREAEGKQTQAELANAQKTLKALQDKYALDAQNSDLADQIAQQQIRVYNIEQQSAADIRSLNRQSRSIEKEEQAKATENYQKEMEKRKQAAANLAEFEQQITKLRQENYINSIEDEGKKALVQIQINWDNEINLVKQKLAERRLTQQQAADLEAEIDKKYFEQRQQERQKQTDEADKQRADADAKLQADQFAKLQASQQRMRDGIAKATADYKAQTEAQIKIDQLAAAKRRAILDTVGNALGAFANLVGKQTAAGKALAVAQATIDTYQSAVSSYKSLAGIPIVGPALGFVAAAAAIAAGIANVREIVNTKVPGTAADSTTAPSAASVAASAPVAPTQVSTSIDQETVNNLGSAVSGRAYVLESDVTRDQNRNERLNRAARLGG